MNQGKLEVVKQEMARVNADILSSIQFSRSVVSDSLQPHVQGALAAQAQEGLEELSHVEGQEGRW